MASPSNRRATKRRRSSIPNSLSTPSTPPARKGEKCYPCVRYEMLSSPDTEVTGRRRSGAPAPERLIENGIPTEALVAHVRTQRNLNQPHLLERRAESTTPLHARSAWRPP